MLTDDSSIGPLQRKEATSSTPRIAQEPAVSSLIVKLNVPVKLSTDSKKRKQHSPEDKGHQTKSAKLSQTSQSKAIENDHQGDVNTKKIRREMLLGPMLEKILSVEAEPVTPIAKPPNVPHVGQWLQILDETASLYCEVHSKVSEGAVDSFNIVKDGLKSPPGGMEMGDWESLIYLYNSRYRSVSNCVEMNLADAWVFDFVSVEAAMRAKKEAISTEEAGRNTWEEFVEQRDSPQGPKEITTTQLDELQDFYKVLTTLRHLECGFILAYRVDRISVCLKLFGGKEAVHIFYEWDQALRQHLQPLHDRLHAQRQGDFRGQSDQIQNIGEIISSIGRKWDNVCSVWSSPLDRAQWRAYAGPEPLSEISDVPTTGLLLNGLPQGRNQSPFINAEISENFREVKLFCVRKVERGDFLGIVPGLINFKPALRGCAIKGPAPGLALECSEAHGMLSALMQRSRRPGRKRKGFGGNVATCWQQYRYEDPETKEETIGWRVICIACKHIEPLHYAGS